VLSSDPRQARPYPADPARACEHAKGLRDPADQATRDGHDPPTRTQQGPANTRRPGLRDPADRATRDGHDPTLRTQQGPHQKGSSATAWTMRDGHPASKDARGKLALVQSGPVYSLWGSVHYGGVLRGTRGQLTNF
jgi:hypothetical protein